MVILTELLSSYVGNNNISMSLKKKFNSFLGMKFIRLKFLWWRQIRCGLEQHHCLVDVY